MKASSWTPSAVGRLGKVTWAVFRSGDLVELVLRRPRPDGSYERLRIQLEGREARALAAELTPAARPRGVPYV